MRIGPFFLELNDLANFDMLVSASAFLDFNDATTSQLIGTVRKLSVFLLLVNSIQASSLPLFVNAYLPPNLYFFLKFFASFIF